jgi:hypothetical protein
MSNNNNNKRKAEICICEGKEKKTKNEKYDDELEKILILNTPDERAALEFVSAEETSMNGLYKILRNGWLYPDHGLLKGIAKRLQIRVESSLLSNALAKRVEKDKKNGYFPCVLSALHSNRLGNSLNTLSECELYTRGIGSELFRYPIQVETILAAFNEDKLENIIKSTDSAKWFSNLEGRVKKLVGKRHAVFFDRWHWAHQAKRMASRALADFLSIISNTPYNGYLDGVESNQLLEDCGIALVNRLLVMASFGVRSSIIVNEGWCKDERLWPSLIRMKIPMSLFIVKVVNLGVELDSKKHFKNLDIAVRFRKQMRAFWKPIDGFLYKKGLCLSIQEKVYSYISGEPRCLLVKDMMESSIIGDFLQTGEFDTDKLGFPLNVKNIIFSYIDEIVQNVIV